MLRRFVVQYGIVLALLASMAASGSDNDLALQSVIEAGTLKVAVYRGLPPYSFVDDDGRLVGIDVDIGRELARRLGVSMSLMPITADETMGDDLRNFLWKGHYLGGGVADVMLHVPIDAAFAEENDQVHFFAPYYQEVISIAYRATNDAAFLNLAAFVNRIIGVELDTMSDYFLSSAYGGRFRENARRYLSVTEAIEALSTKEVEAVMAPWGELHGVLERRGKAGYFRIQPVHLGGMFRNAWVVGLGVKAGNNSLADALQEALTEMTAEKTIEKVFSTYGVQYKEPENVE